jgi:hypothetical protein
MNAAALAIGFFLVGLSMIPLLYGVSVAFNAAAFGFTYSGTLSSTVGGYLAFGGVLLASGLAIIGAGIALDSKALS